MDAMQTATSKIAALIVDLVNNTDGPVTLARVDRRCPRLCSEEPSELGLRH